MACGRGNPAGGRGTHSWEAWSPSIQERVLPRCLLHLPYLDPLSRQSSQHTRVCETDVMAKCTQGLVARGPRGGSGCPSQLLVQVWAFLHRTERLHLSPRLGATEGQMPLVRRDIESGGLRCTAETRGKAGGCDKPLCAESAQVWTPRGIRAGEASLAPDAPQLSHIG